MSLVKLAKLGIVSGIVLVGFVIAMVIIPNFIRQHEHLFEEQMNTNLSREDARVILMESQEYSLFSERFPGHEVKFSYEDRGQYSRLNAMAFNEKTGNALILEVSYAPHDGEIHGNIDCDATKRTSGERYHAYELMVIPFIKTTTCLD